MRKRPNLTDRLASTLLQLKRGNGEWLIPEPIRSTGDAKAICAHVEWDHAIVPVAIGGTNAPQNLQPLMKADHKVKTKRDRKEIDKGKRVIRAREKHEANMAAKSGEVLYAPPRKCKRPFPGSRASGIRKHLDGRITRR